MDASGLVKLTMNRLSISDYGFSPEQAAKSSTFTIQAPYEEAVPLSEATVRSKIREFVDVLEPESDEMRKGFLQERIYNRLFTNKVLYLNYKTGEHRV